MEKALVVSKKMYLKIIAVSHVLLQNYTPLNLERKSAELRNADMRRTPF